MRLTLVPREIRYIDLILLIKCSLGIFDTALALGWTHDKKGHMSIWRSYLFGGLSGSIGSCLGSPFFLVKTHMQSYANAKVAVGFQRNHEGMIQAFRKIYSIRGIRGLYRGVIGNIPRAALGNEQRDDLYFGEFLTIRSFCRRWGSIGDV